VKLAKVWYSWGVSIAAHRSSAHRGAGDVFHRANNWLISAVIARRWWGLSIGKIAKGRGPFRGAPELLH